MIRKKVNIDQVPFIIETLIPHSDKSIKETLSYWAEKILIRHFQFGNQAAYGYKSLSPKYLARKEKKWGRKPILVASGKLRDEVTGNYRVYRYAGKWKIVLKVPEYGNYVREVRDYTLINKRDQRDMNRFWKADMSKRRKRFVTKLR
jgi:hypothetical protein